MPSIMFEKYGPGKFEDSADEAIYELWSNGHAVDEASNRYGEVVAFLTFDDDDLFIIDCGEDGQEIYHAAIILEDSDGFVDVTFFEDIDKARNYYETCVKVLNPRR